MEKLAGVDDVAYVRFASVYRQFKDVNQFMRELQGILDPRLRPPRRAPGFAVRRASGETGREASKDVKKETKSENKKPLKVSLAALASRRSPRGARLAAKPREAEGSRGKPMAGRKK